MEDNYDDPLSDASRSANERNDESLSIEMMSAVTASPQKGSALMSRMSLNDNKAGMEGLDKCRINQIIYEASKGSKFFENERKKEQQLDCRIQEQQSLRKTLSPAKLLQGTREADKLLQVLEEKRDLSHSIVHVDMDAFYAAVEMRDNPSLKNKPMAVGGLGMLSTSNYIARRFGVRAAMPGFIGLKLCPDLVLVKPNFEKYSAVSQEIRDLFAAYDPNFCPMSLDEAYLDFTAHLERRMTSSVLSRTYVTRSEEITVQQQAEVCTCDLNEVLRPQILTEFQSDEHSDHELRGNIETFNLSDRGDETQLWKRMCTSCGKNFPRYEVNVYGIDIEEAVLEMRNRIEQRTQLTASAGIAPNMMLAKVCSDKNKPNGQYRIPPEKGHISIFMKDLPIRKISGIGKVTEKLLGALNIETCSDLYQHRGVLYHLFSATSFHYFMRITLGIGSTTVERDGIRKSMSTETTFLELSQPNELLNKCQELCHSLSEDMQDEQLLGKTVTLKIKTVSFEIRTRSHTLHHYTNEESKLFSAAKLLLNTEIDACVPNPLRLRLMGIRMSKLVPQSSHPTVVSMFEKHLKGESAPAVVPSHVPSSMTDFYPEADGFKEDNVSVGEALDTKVAENDQREWESDDDSEIFTLPVQYLDTQQTDHKDVSSVGTSRTDVKNQPTKANKINSRKSNSTILKFVCKEDRQQQQIANAQKSSSVISESNAFTPDCNTMHTFVENSDKNYNEGKETGANQIENVKEISNAGLIAHLDLKSKMVCCPVCGQQRMNWCLDRFNVHVDLCLSKQTIKDILQDEHLNTRTLPESSGNSKKRVKSSTSLLSHRKDVKRSKTQPSVLAFFKS